MLAEKITFLTEIEAALNSQLKQIKSERKALEAKQLKLNQWLELQNELLSDPDTADSLGGGVQAQIAPITIEIEAVESTAIAPTAAPDIEAFKTVMAAAAGIWETPATETIEAIPDETTSNSDEITVIWETEGTGYTLDSDGVKRAFEFEDDKWDHLAQPYISLITSKGRVISSNWRSKAIAKNQHFQAIKNDHLRHFKEQVSLMGYELEDLPSMGHTARFKVFKNGTELGQIGTDFSLWFIGHRSVYASTKYGKVTEVLAALEDSITAKEDIGF